MPLLFTYFYSRSISYIRPLRTQDPWLLYYYDYLIRLVIAFDFNCRDASENARVCTNELDICALIHFSRVEWNSSKGMESKKHTTIVVLYLDKRINCFRRKNTIGLNNRGTREARYFSPNIRFQRSGALFVNEQIYAVLWHFSFWRLKRRNSLSASWNWENVIARNIHRQRFNRIISLI